MVNKWHCVEDKLPDTPRRVLVYEAVTAERGRIHISIYCDDLQEWEYPEYDGGIAYWMELPKKPGKNNI